MALSMRIRSRELGKDSPSEKTIFRSYWITCLNDASLTRFVSFSCTNIKRNSFWINVHQEYDKWIGIEASKRIALFCSRTSRKYTIQQLIHIINEQSIGPQNYPEVDFSAATGELPEDPRTSLSTPAPPPYKRGVSNDGDEVGEPSRRGSEVQNSAMLPEERVNSNPNPDGRESSQPTTQITKDDEYGQNRQRNPIYDLHHSMAPDSHLHSSSVTKGDYALMLLVELAYEMDPTDDDFNQNLALMLHVAILGLDHPFRSLGEHCKRLLMNVIHCIHFRDNHLEKEKPQSAQELMMYLVSKRGKQMWCREMICPQHLSLTSSRYLQFLVQWLVDVVSEKECKKVATFWGDAAIKWMEKCSSSFLACRSIQIYRSLQGSFLSKYNKEVFGSLMNTLEDQSKCNLWPEIFIVMKTWTPHIPLSELDVWSKLIWNTMNICKCEPASRPHVYVHGLSLLASILQFLDLKKNNEIWDQVINDVDDYMIDGGKRSEFEGIQSFVVKGLLCDSTRRQSEEFLNGLTLMDDHPVICSKSARLHMTVVAQIPSICHYLQQNTNTVLIQEHLQSMCRTIAALFHQKEITEIASRFDKILTYDVDKLLSKILKPIAAWISEEAQADINVVKMLLDLLEHTDTSYKRHVLCVLHGILLWVDWDESELSEVESNFFDRITDLLATNLWREATMILEVVVKFNNNSSESASLLFSHDDNFKSPQKGILCLNPLMVQSPNEFFDGSPHKKQIGYHQTSRLECADQRGGFRPSAVSRDIPPFSPNNLKTKSVQHQRRQNIQLQRRYSADESQLNPSHREQIPDQPWTPKKTHKSGRNGKKMVSAALASWQLVVDETKNETNCSPLPPNKYYSQMREQKIVKDLLQNSSFCKSNADEDRSHFSARRSLDRLLTFSGLKKDKHEELATWDRTPISNRNNGKIVTRTFANVHFGDHCLSTQNTGSTGSRLELCDEITPIPPESRESSESTSQQFEKGFGEKARETMVESMSCVRPERPLKRRIGKLSTKTQNDENVNSINEVSPVETESIYMITDSVENRCEAACEKVEEEW